MYSAGFLLVVRFCSRVRRRKTTIGMQFFIEGVRVGPRSLYTMLLDGRAELARRVSRPAPIFRSWW